MRNITFSADEKQIEAARERARANRTTLNEEFRRWLSQYAKTEQRADQAMDLIGKIQRYARTGGRHLSRDELNER